VFDSTRQHDGNAARRADVNELTRAKLAALGDAGRRWLDGLSVTITDFEQQWEITTGDPLSGGTTALVLAARRSDGRDAVLKLAIPDSPDGGGAFARELRAVQLGQGRGYVELLASNAARGAMLLERLGRPLGAAGLPVEDQIEILAATVAQAWQPDPSSFHWRTEADQASALREFVRSRWSMLGHPCADRVIRRAERCAQRRADAFDPATAVVIHADAHPFNLLEAADGSYRATDPDAMLSHPAHELGIVLRDWSVELLNDDDDPQSRLDGWCRQLGEQFATPPEDISDWAYLERVSSGLYLLELGDARGHDFLAVADVLAHD
jgi:streptomycin 6-kinase